MLQKDYKWETWKCPVCFCNIVNCSNFVRDNHDTAVCRLELMCHFSTDWRRVDPQIEISRHRRRPTLNWIPPVLTCPADGMRISNPPERASLNGALDLCFPSAAPLFPPSSSTRL